MPQQGRPAGAASHTLLMGLLLGVLLALAGPAAARSGVYIEGLPGLDVKVAAAPDPSTELGLADMLKDGKWEPWLEGGRGPLQSGGVWYRIDLHVPAALRGQTLWLQLVPATAWLARLHLPDGTLQEAGMSVPNAQHSHPAILSRFKVVLDQPQIRLYLMVGNTLAPLNHLSFLSDHALTDQVQAAAQRQGLFIGAAVLMLLMALMNWFGTRHTVHLAFSAYISSALALVLFTTGYVAQYLVTNAPAAVARANLMAGGLVVACTIWFSIEVLQLRHRLPRLAAGLQVLVWVALALGVLGLNTDWIAPLGKLLWISHLVIGLLLLGASGWLAWRERDAQTLVIFAGYLLFNIFEKVPLLTMAGLLPVHQWSGDVARLGLVFQMLLIHLHLVLRVRAQRDIEQQALAASLEAQSERNQRAELSKFLGMFGHEVRTPLAIIDAATQSLEMLPGSESQQHGQRHQRIRAAVQRLDRLAREALSRERMSAGSLHLRTRPLALAALIEDTLTLQGLQAETDALADGLVLPMDIAGQPGGSLRLRLPAGTTDLLDLPELLADPDLLQVVLGNLLDNARKYADAGSQVLLQLDLLPGVQRPEHWRCSVTSQGAELSAAELELVFEKYWRRDEHGNMGGAGLGLHLVRTIAQLHGGRAWAESQAGRRTAFHVELPLTAPRAG